MQKKIGMVIVNYNDFENTDHLIKNVEDYKCLNHIVIVDNNSKDDSFEKLKSLEKDNLTVIKNNSRNYSSGLNTGAKFLIEKLGVCNIIFSNSDISIKQEEDLINLSETMKEDIVVVGPTIDEHGVINRGWHLPSVNQEILFNIPYFNRNFKRKYLLYKDSDYEKETTLVDVVSGCFFVVDSDFLKKVDYFDSSTLLYYEEQILAEKVKKENKKECINNKIIIYHNHSVTVDKSIKRLEKQKILKESQRYYIKNYKKSNIMQRILLYITDYVYRGFLYIVCLLKSFKWKKYFSKKAKISYVK